MVHKSNLILTIEAAICEIDLKFAVRVLDSFAVCLLEDLMCRLRIICDDHQNLVLALYYFGHEADRPVLFI
jgi:hypothetical protein